MKKIREVYIEELKALREEYEQKQVANKACINGITLSIDRLEDLRKLHKGGE